MNPDPRPGVGKLAGNSGISARNLNMIDYAYCGLSMECPKKKRNGGYYIVVLVGSDFYQG